MDQWLQSVLHPLPVSLTNINIVFQHTCHAVFYVQLSGCVTFWLCNFAKLGRSESDAIVNENGSCVSKAVMDQIFWYFSCFLTH